MDYSNNNIMLLRQQNKQLRQKVEKLNNICKNLIESTNQSQEQFAKKTINNSVANNLHHQYLENQLQLNQTQILNLRKQLEQINNYLHQCEKSLILKSQQINQLSSQVKSLKFNNLNLQRYRKQQFDNLKQYYEVIVINQKQQQFSQLLIQIKTSYQTQIKQLKSQISLLKSKNCTITTQNEILQKKKIDYQNKQYYFTKNLNQSKNIIKNLQKSMLQESQHYKKQIELIKSQNETIKLKYYQLYKQFISLKSINQQYKLQKLQATKQLNSLKRQKQRSCNKVQRQLLRERSLSKNALKNIQIQAKYYQSEIIKKNEIQSMYRKQQKQLISKISSLKTQNEQSLNNSRLQNEKIAISKTKASLTPLKDINLNSSPFQKETNKTPNSIKLTPNTTKSTTYSTNQNKSKLAISSTKNISKTIQMIKQSKDKSINSSRVSLVGQQFRDLIHQVGGFKQSGIAQSSNIHNFSSIQNQSYFPSTKSSKTHCQIEQDIKQLNKYMRQSFNPKVSQFQLEMNPNLSYEISNKEVSNKEVSNNDYSLNQYQINQKLKFQQLQINMSVIQQSHGQVVKQKQLRLSDLDTPCFQSNRSKPNDYQLKNMSKPIQTFQKRKLTIKMRK